jgi:hypothetical protein
VTKNKWVDQAVAHCIDEIALCQQNIAAMFEVNRRITDRDRRHKPNDTEFSNASNVYWMIMHEQLTAAWDNLAMFAPISKKAMELLSERTRTWFDTDEDSIKGGIMGFLGFKGSYYAKDEEEFRAEVLEMFGIVRPKVNDAESVDDENH